MMKPVSLTVLLVALSLLVCYAYGDEQPGKFKQGSEPDGFFGIKWGTSIDTFKNMELVTYAGTVPGISPSEIKWYKKEPYFVTIQDIFLLNVYYGFWKDQFIAVEASIPDAKSYDTLQNIFGGLYGQGFHNREWTGLKTQITLRVTSSGYSLTMIAVEGTARARKE